MKLTQSSIKFSFCALFYLGTTQLVHCDPTIFKYGSFSVDYSQTTSGITSVENYHSSLGISVSEFGDFDLSTHFPSSITYSGSPLFPNSQLELVIPYNAQVPNAISGPNYWGGTGSNSWGVLPSSGGWGNFWSGGGVWSSNLSDVSSLTATLNGSALDGYQTTAAFDSNLLPTIPLLTNQSLSALAHIAVNQATILSFIQPLTPAVSAYFSIYAIDSQNSYSWVSDGQLDLVQNPSGITIPPNTFLKGNSYMLGIADFWNLPAYRDFDSYTYGTGNSIKFTVKSRSVPDTGSTIAMLGSALFGLAVLRRRSVTHSNR
jgi:hypothetical protein